ncbi:MAG: hypothetical protein RAP41_06960 [Candidatus Orphnella occulta]|nr:hypothetical protein [Candidatus Orphnella occulta]
MNILFTKKLIFGLILSFFIFLIMELVLSLGYAVVKRDFFPYGKYREMIHVVATDSYDDKKKLEPGEIQSGKEIIHPYFGYTYNFAKEPWRISEYGFIDPKSPILNDTDSLNIAVLGGSFAAHICMYAKDALVESLQMLGSNVTITNLALGGYKQPQQLLILNYLLSLDAHFDIVINIDGFNEIVLPPIENIPAGVFPFYPRQWQLRVANIYEPEIAIKLARLDVLRQKRHQQAKFFDRKYLSRSVLMCLVWSLLDLKFMKEEYNLSIQLHKLQPEDFSRPSVTGPEFSFTNEDSLYKTLAIHWGRCSKLIDKICKSNNICYFHFLQPNQYVDGSKPMSSKETAIAIDEKHIYRASVIKGYPYLRNVGTQLKEDINFYDMTMIFSNNTNVLYSDTCCHLNKNGCEIIARRIGELITDYVLKVDEELHRGISLSQQK